METRFETMLEKKLAGKYLMMSFAENKTVELWRSFMPLRFQLKNTISTDLFSLEIFPAGYFSFFNPQTPFKKWAAIEVEDFVNLPDGLQPLIIPKGLYAVFIHYGPASDGPKTYDYIFRTWLPVSGYILEERPHFAIMGEKYKNYDPASEEEIWIPVRQTSESTI